MIAVCVAVDPHVSRFLGWFLDAASSCWFLTLARLSWKASKPKNVFRWMNVRRAGVELLASPDDQPITSLIVIQDWDLGSGGYLVGHIQLGRERRPLLLAAAAVQVIVVFTWPSCSYWALCIWLPIIFRIILFILRSCRIPLRNLVWSVLIVSVDVFSVIICVLIVRWYALNRLCSLLLHQRLISNNNGSFFSRSHIGDGVVGAVWWAGELLLFGCWSRCLQPLVNTITI